MRKKNPADKRKRHNVLLSDNEVELLKAKMLKYGYNNLSVYLRDAAIYERLFVEDIQGKLEINTVTSNLIYEIKKFQSQIQDLMMNVVWNDEERKSTLMLLNRVDRDLKELVNVINDTLWVSTKKVAYDPNTYVQQLSLFDEENDDEEE